MDTAVTHKTQHSNITIKALDLARRVLQLEAEEIQSLAKRLDSTFERAVALLLSCKGRVVVTGMGKSGHIGGKIASTFASTGTPAFFMHPGEASHGDLGMITHGDVVLALSNSGESDEMVAILPAIKRLGAGIISITGNDDSTLARVADIHLSAKVAQEACPLGLAPTTSTTVALALGDALALCILDAREFTAEDFARSHPGGNLGRKLLTKVRDVMRTGDAIPQVKQGVYVNVAITEITSKGMGFVVVVDEQQTPVGIFTDGDLRRAFLRQIAPQTTPIEAVMQTQPKTLIHTQLAIDAVNMMEHFKINGFVVVDEHTRLVGAFNMHDLLKAKVV